MRKKDNRGLTLIELVVTIAIIAIFGGAVAMLISNGGSSFRSTSGNAQVQMETQEALDQIQNMAIDANRSLYYGTGDIDSLNYVADDIDGAAGSSRKSLVVCSAYESAENQVLEDYVWNYVTWNPATSQLLYSSKEKKGQPKFEADVTPTPEITQSPEGKLGETFGAIEAFTSGSSPEASPVSAAGAEVKTAETVLADDITGFWADVSQVEKKRILRFQIETNKKGKVIKTLHTVHLRNDLKILSPGEISSLPDADAKIKIVNAPEALEVTVGSWGFEKVTFGDVVPGTISWSVAGSEGGFVPINKDGIMTLSPDFTGDSITVTVTAKSASGKQLSDSVRVIITRKKAVPEKLIANSSSVVLGVGNTYSLQELVPLQVKYSDGTIKDIAGTEVSWSGSIESSEIQSNGNTGNIDPELGTDPANANYKATVSCTIDGVSLSADLSILLARVDLTKPAGTYQAGKDKKELEYVYKEGGIEKTSSDYTLTVKGTGASEGKTMENYKGSLGKLFTAEEIGHWTAEIQIMVNYKPVKDSSDFSVKPQSGGGEIYVFGSKECQILPRARDYTLSYNINQGGIHFMPEDSEEYHWDSTIKWSLKEQVEGVTLVSNGSDKFTNNITTLSIFDNASKGFVLCADYENKTTGQRVHAEKEIKVATRLEIAGSDFAVAGQPYIFDAILHVVNRDGAEENLKIIETEEEIQNQKYKISWEMQPVWAEITRNNGHFEFITPSDTADLTLTATVGQVPQVMNGVKPIGWKVEKNIIITDYQLTGIEYITPGNYPLDLWKMENPKTGETCTFDKIDDKKWGTLHSNSKGSKIDNASFTMTEEAEEIVKIWVNLKGNEEGRSSSTLNWEVPSSGSQYTVSLKMYLPNPANQAVYCTNGNNDRIVTMAVTPTKRSDPS